MHVCCCIWNERSVRVFCLRQLLAAVHHWVCLLHRFYRRCAEVAVGTRRSRVDLCRLLKSLCSMQCVHSSPFPLWMYNVHDHLAVIVSNFPDKRQHSAKSPIVTSNANYSPHPHTNWQKSKHRAQVVTQCFTTKNLKIRLLTNDNILYMQFDWLPIERADFGEVWQQLLLSLCEDTVTQDTNVLMLIFYS